MKTTALFMVLLIVPSFLAPAQRISFGVTGGVPISNASQDDAQACFDTRSAPSAPNQTLCGPNRFFSKPYTVGPTIALRLPWRFSFEAGMLYERFHKDVAHGVAVLAGGGVSNFGQYFGASANGWLFPLLLRYDFGGRRLSPFVDAGPTLRHLGAFNGAGVELNFFLQPLPSSFHIESGRDLDVADTLGAGLRWHAGAFDISPEIRFLHWTSAYYQPVQNRAMLMLSVMFPASR